MAKAFLFFWIALSVVVLLVFSAIRFAAMRDDPSSADAFEIRYLQHPWTAAIHIVPGLLFLMLAPLQFTTAIRRRSLRVHRRLGWLLVTCAALSGAFGIAASFQFPAYGGGLTLAATLVFGSLFALALMRAVTHIRRRQIAPHREWMIRLYALALGVATIRLYIGIFTAGGYAFADVFGVSFWLGFSTNLLAAEWWIANTRLPRRVAPSSRQTSL